MNPEPYFTHCFFRSKAKGHKVTSTAVFAFLREALTWGPAEGVLVRVWVLPFFQVLSYVQVGLVKTHWSHVGVILEQDLPHLLADSSVLVKPQGDDHEVRAQLLGDEARHGCPHPEATCQVIGSRLKQQKKQVWLQEWYHPKESGRLTSMEEDPTAIGLSLREGSSLISTAAKKASMSRWTMVWEKSRMDSISDRWASACSKETAVRNAIIWQKGVCLPLFLLAQSPVDWVSKASAAGRGFSDSLALLCDVRSQNISNLSFMKRSVEVYLNKAKELIRGQLIFTDLWTSHRWFYWSVLCPSSPFQLCCHSAACVTGVEQTALQK